MTCRTYTFPMLPHRPEEIVAFVDDELASICFRASDPRYWLIVLYGAFARMQPPRGGAIHAVVDNFGNLVRVA